MNVTVHPPTRKVEDATRVLHVTDTGPVTEVHLQPEAGFLVFRDTADYDWLISVLVAARHDHAEAQARHEAHGAPPPLEYEPLPELPVREPQAALEALKAEDRAQADAAATLARWGADPTETAALGEDPP